MQRKAQMRIMRDAVTQRGHRLFQPFATTKNDGNGLGLWISLGLVERYGGSINAGNQEDGQRGAVFSVRLLTEPRVPDATPTRDGRPGLLQP